MQATGAHALPTRGSQGASRAHLESRNARAVGQIPAWQGWSTKGVLGMPTSSHRGGPALLEPPVSQSYQVNVTYILKSYFKYVVVCLGLVFCFIHCPQDHAY